MYHGPLDLKITDLSKVALFPGTHKTKTEPAEEVEIFNDEKSVMLSSFSSCPNPVWHGTGHFYPFVLLKSDFVSRTFLEVKIDIN